MPDEVTAGWLEARVSEASQPDGEGVVSDPEVTLLKALLAQWAIGFASARSDVASASITWPSRGVRQDEARSFLRAVEAGLVIADSAGYFSLPSLRPKTPSGRYALFSRSGDGVAINLEYLIQAGATAELVLDLGWAPQEVDFERGEFDCLARDHDGEVVLVMEAKARISGSDSLARLMSAWLKMAADSDADLDNNAGRKWREIVRLAQERPLNVWLVADGARWSMTATKAGGDSVRLYEARPPARSAVVRDQASTTFYTVLHYDAAFHAPDTVAGRGRCSWHGLQSCERTPVISFRDMQGMRQSGCSRAVRELAARGEIDKEHAKRFGE